MCVEYSYWEGVLVMTAGRQIDDLIATLQQSVEAGLAYFQGPGSQSKVMIGHWGTREVLCHLVWWHQATVEGIESVAKGGAPYSIHASVDEMNARAVGRMAGRDVNQSGTYGPSLVELARQWQARLVQAARAIPDPNTTVLIMGDGSGRSVRQRLETMAQHWNEHVTELQALSAA
jgi:hypothetical protein